MRPTPTRPGFTRTLAPALAALLVLAGCAAAPGPQYYSLAETTSPGPAQPAAAAPVYIELAPIAMPERFARPQFVVRKKEAPEGVQVDILEQHRWSSSFENELRDALGSGVARRLGAVDLTKTGRQRGQQPIRIAVQLRQFDAIEGSRVDASFSWTLRRGDDGPSTACQADFSESVESGFDALARGAQRATARLADAIAGSVNAMQARPSPACAG